MVRQRRVAIVVDSSCCLPPDVPEVRAVHVVPHELVLDDQVYRDGIDIQPSQFYQLLKANQYIPTTSAPKPSTFLDAFEKASREAESVLCLTLSANFSATYNSARVAAEMAASKMPNVPIRVMDTHTAAGAHGLIALEAELKAREGASLDQVVARVEELVPKVQLLAFLDTLTYLQRGGRIPKVAAWAGSILGIKPLTEMRMGVARLLEKPRSRAKATQRLLDIAKSRVGNQRVHANIMHAHCLEDALALKEKAGREMNCARLFITEFTPVMGAHIGPGLLGIAFYTE